MFEQAIIFFLTLLIVLLFHKIRKADKEFKELLEQFKIHKNTDEKFRDWSYNEIRNCHSQIKHIKGVNIAHHERLNLLEPEELSYLQQLNIQEKVNKDDQS